MTIVAITGCSSGIGLETALAFARRGDTVIATMRDLGRAEQLQKRAAAEDLTVHLERLDVRDCASVDAAIASILGRHGTIDVLVNNAGILGQGPVEAMSIEDAAGVMDTNFWGPMRTIRAALPAMRAQGSGVIINVSSIASRLPALPHGSAYTASKTALNALSESLAVEVTPFGIRVVSIEPGFFKTEISTHHSETVEPASEVYQADLRWVGSFIDAGVNGGANPVVVAEAIVAAACDPATRLHTPVGDDAAMYLGLLDEVGSFEEWVDALVPQIEAAIGPRPKSA